MEADDVGWSVGKYITVSFVILVFQIFYTFFIVIEWFESLGDS